ncbi:VIT1/CCC1 transporter family protein [Levilactobacillus namurensis]|uniref:VIT1/CCC1 transporter family protein n=1 Tax=Levilactobacillus namurensis TaxID=380393 RepID=UPI0022312D62|nr:VIT family protein [Levilactobacillus namurensis]MCW3778264.1 VIT family protein [Levilactobacillus namurensis]MDT7019232.1 VIT family protein [Levilactobacillus namurensis]WNN66165.1 VIT family protein [Levilactobacillus namurensis]
MATKKKTATLAQKINVLRASVMGANDGILSVAGIVVGVAGAATSSFAIFISGIAGMIAGTVSMAMGEYVSVNTQKDSQRKAIETQTVALDNDYDSEYNFVKNKYIASGIKPELADQATQEMMKKDPLKTSVRERFGFNVGEYTNPFSAAIASMISFPTGSILPLVSITLLPKNIRIVGTFIAVVVALAITGYIAAILGNANRKNGTIRNVIAGILTLLVTYFIGRLFA